MPGRGGRGGVAGAGGSAGAIGGMVLLTEVLSVRIAMFIVANALLVLMGLYLAGGPALITRFEAVGRTPWRHISRLTRGVLPVDSWPRALLAGSIWGWLPCGLTYSVLAIALVSGSGARGATLMAVFGLGTLPNLLAAGMLVTPVRPWLQRLVVRRISGCLLLAFGVAGVAHATGLGEQI